MTSQQSKTTVSAHEKSRANGEVLLEAQNLEHRGSKEIRLLQDVSLLALSGEVIALVSANAASRSALLNILAGRMRPFSGNVTFSGVEIYQKKKIVPPVAGFVPKNDPLHQDLKVIDVLRYSAALRQPKDISAARRKEHLQEILNEMGLSGLASHQVKTLTPEQCKRLSLAVELVASPGLIFMEEPFVGLSPGQQSRLLALLHRLASRGTAVILTTQSITSLKFADKMLVILADGQVGWFGPPNEALSFFNQHTAPPGQNGKVVAFAELFNIIETGSPEQAREWAERFKANPAYRQYLNTSVQSDPRSEISLEERPLARRKVEKQAEAAVQPAPQKVSGIRQFFTLTGRNLLLLFRSPASLLMLLGLPLLGAALLFLFTNGSIYDRVAGNSTLIMYSLGLLVFLTMLAGGAVWARDIQKEAQVYGRERKASLKLVPYVMSKLLAAALFAPYAALVLTLGYYLAVSPPGGLTGLVLFFITLLLVAFTGAALGLAASALARTPAAAALLFGSVLVLHLLVSGAFFPVPGMNRPGNILSIAAPSRSGVDALVGSTGYARDVARDVCLGLPAAERMALTDQQKQSCACLGINLFSHCNFPGVGSYQLNSSPEPARPVFDNEANRLPAQPVPAPGVTLEEYIQQVNEYTLSIEANRQNLNNYIASLREYMEEIAAWEKGQELAIVSAESLIEREYDRYQPSFTANLASSWENLLASAFVLSIIFAIAQRNKESGT